jgi:hypothetical protein
MEISVGVLDQKRACCLCNASTSPKLSHHCAMPPAQTKPLQGIKIPKADGGKRPVCGTLRLHGQISIVPGGKLLGTLLFPGGWPYWANCVKPQTEIRAAITRPIHDTDIGTE